ncbi:hypothetical protein A9179_02445 [Pseudomonas alcaligenes]|uniref:Uncharacterized protein n=2 Tax=Aquipseudomonas alcaligenes TaxID=43263 RepID=A0ABR7RWF7_AQUAC|nr:hypothetical protein [Pseudomonas alcaligenes]
MLSPDLNKYIIKYDETIQEVIFKRFSIRNLRVSDGSNFLRAIDRRGLDELAALLVLIRAQEMQGNYAISQRLRKLLLNFFIEISHLDEFQAVVVRIFQQTCQVFFDDFHKDANGLGFEFMLENGLENLDYTLGVIEQISSMEPRRDDPYSSILGGARNLEIGGNSRAKSH